MKNFISNVLFFVLTTLTISANADSIDLIQLELNELSEKTNSVFKQAKETNNKVKMNTPIDCVDFIESTDDGVLIQFTKGGCLSDDQILNKKIKDQDYFSGGLFHTSCKGLICKRTYRVDDRPFDEIAKAHELASEYTSEVGFTESIIRIADDLYRKSYDENKKIVSDDLGKEISCSAKIVADAKKHTIQITFPNVCPVPFSSVRHKGNVKVRPQDFMDSLSTQPGSFGYASIREEKKWGFKKEVYYTFETQCQNTTCIMREKELK